MMGNTGVLLMYKFYFVQQNMCAELTTGKFIVELTLCGGFCNGNCLHYVH